MISSLADKLRLAGINATVSELEDILWLASRLPPTDVAAVQQHDTAPQEQESSEDGAHTGAESDAQESSFQPPPLSPAPAPARAGEPAATSIFSDTGLAGTLEAGVLRVPGVAGAPAPDQLRRALQPFRRRIASRRHARFDEEATATQAAEKGFWSPLFAPARERCFALTLVIEDSTSAAVRDRALLELSSALSSHGAMRSMRTARLGGGSVPQLLAENGSVLNMHQLRRSDRHEIVLFATDGTSSRWRNGGAQAFLHLAGGQAAVSILHLLPRSAWCHTAVGEPEVLLHARHVGETNSHHQYHLPQWMENSVASASMPVPVIGFDSASIAQWANFASLRGAASIDGVLVAPPPNSQFKVMPETESETNAAQQTARFRQMASPDTFELAVYLSAVDPLTIPIMRLIQRSMAPETGDAELAEFLLGRLVFPTPPALATGETLYRFHEGVRTELNRALRYSEETAIRRQLVQVGRFLAVGSDGLSTFAGTFPVPSGPARLTEWALPFAQVSQEALQRFIDPAHASTASPEFASAEVPTSTARDQLRILHLSDLHIGVHLDRAPDEIRPELGAPWEAFLRGFADTDPIDLVCFSGDLTWAGQPTQFAYLSTFFDATLRALSLPRDRMMIVPGNHDLTRPSDNQQEPISAPLNRLQTAYRNWAREYLPHFSVGPDKTCANYSCQLTGWNIPIRVLCLDNSWLSLPKTDQTVSYRAQLEPPKRAQQEFVVALMHHAPEKMGSPVRLASRLESAGVRLLMYGLSGRRVVPISPGATMVRSTLSGLSPRAIDTPTVRVLDVDLRSLDHPEVGPARVFSWNQDVFRWEQAKQPLHEVVKQTVLSEWANQAEDEQQKIPFFGRRRELRELISMMKESESDASLAFHVLILGPKGIGKTALALRFVKEHWNSREGVQGAHVLINASDMHNDEKFMSALPIEAQSKSSFSSLADHLLSRHILLIVRNVETADDLRAIEGLSERLRRCSVIGLADDSQHVDLLQVATRMSIKVLRLDWLDQNASVELLSRASASAFGVTQEQLGRIAQALLGVPRALHLAGRILSSARAAAPLLHWIASSDQKVPSQALLKDADRFSTLTDAMVSVIQTHIEQWRAQRTKGASFIPELLAHGPLSGSTPLLAMAIAGMDETKFAPWDQDFLELCQQAEAAGIRVRPKTVNMIPMWAMCLRSVSPQHGPVVMDRWSRWIAERLSASEQDSGSWDELNDDSNALHEWLATCPLDAGTLVQDICLPFIRAFGVMAPWRDFCQRMLTLIPARHKALPRWYLLSARLAEMDNDLPTALREVRHAMDAAEGSTDLRKDAIALREAIQRKLMPGRGLLPSISEDDVATSDTQMQLPKNSVLPHHARIGKLAALATVVAHEGSRRAGTIIQAAGTGMVTSLLAYLRHCSQDAALRQLKYVVVADRPAVCQQIRARCRELERAGFSPFFEPGTVDELNRRMTDGQPGIIITTVRKAQMIKRNVSDDAVVVYFSLRAGALSKSLITKFRAATWLEFSHEARLVIPLRRWAFGPIITSYMTSDGIADGILRPVKILLVTFEGPQAAVLGNIANYIAQNRAEARWPGTVKSLVIVDEPDAVRVLGPVFHAHGFSKTFVVTKTMLANELAVAVNEFNRVENENALCFASPDVILNLYFRGVDVCYVVGRVSAEVMFKVQSTVNQPSPQKDNGEIVDFSGSDWKLLSSDLLNTATATEAI